LAIPALHVLATVADDPSRRLAVLHILETSLIGWHKQIRNVLKQQPAISATNAAYFTKDEIQLWTSYINKLNNLLVQLDAPHVQDILMNLENNNSSYVCPFKEIKSEIKQVITFKFILALYMDERTHQTRLRFVLTTIKKVIKASEVNLRFISTLTPWVSKIKSENLLENAQYCFTGLFHTLLLIWKNSV
jgi:hypothetical protein